MNKKQIAFSAEDDLREWIEDMARRERRSVSAQINYMLSRVRADRIAAEQSSQIDTAELARMSGA